jgi:hypothetical protein
MGILSLVEAAAMFSKIAVEMDHIKHHGLDEGAKILQEEAKRELGGHS